MTSVPKTQKMSYTKSPPRRIHPIGKLLRWSFKRCCNSYHDISTENPEDVVHEKSSEKNTSDREAVEMEDFDTSKRESQTKDVVGDPVLLDQIPETEDRGHHQTHQIDAIELNVHVVRLVIIFTFIQNDLIVSVGEVSSQRKTHQRAK